MIQELLKELKQNGVDDRKINVFLSMKDLWGVFSDLEDICEILKFCARTLAGKDDSKFAYCF